MNLLLIHRIYDMQRLCANDFQSQLSSQPVRAGDGRYIVYCGVVDVVRTIRHTAADAKIL